MSSAKLNSLYGMVVATLVITIFMWVTTVALIGVQFQLVQDFTKQADRYGESARQWVSQTLDAGVPQLSGGLVEHLSKFVQ
jgi:hypothetical protein